MNINFYINAITDSLKTNSFFDIGAIMTGTGAWFRRIQSNDNSSRHDFHTTVRAFNESVRNAQMDGSSIFFKSLSSYISVLEEKTSLFNFEIFSVFNVIWQQLALEEYKLSSFELNKNDTMNFLKDFERLINSHKNDLSSLSALPYTSNFDNRYDYAVAICNKIRYFLR